MRFPSTLECYSTGKIWFFRQWADVNFPHFLQRSLVCFYGFFWEMFFLHYGTQSK
ncbi:uncharacterized protein LOC141894112 isoform X2 [Acropora palmata]|uniref:uncharacterized protein LOC141894112 isoform X2 n=1 Tax=Acropora palmata TaxID=6131 RepID=UPI003DA0BB53